MDDLGRPSRRQASSTRRSSSRRPTSNSKPPRTRASNQSLQSAGRPQGDTTFTSFEPFSPPSASMARNGSRARSPQGRETSSARSYSASSSKRSRSIFAPHRQNSVTEGANDPAVAAATQATATATATATADAATATAAAAAAVTTAGSSASSVSRANSQRPSQVSRASLNLHQQVFDMEPDRSDHDHDHDRAPLFGDSLDAYRNNPSSLAEASDEAIYTLCSREGGAHNVVRTLAQDLAKREAEFVQMRKRHERFTSLFKDHMTSIHEMSRLDADRAVQQMAPSATELSFGTNSEGLLSDMDEASANPFGDMYEVREGSTGTAPRTSTWAEQMSVLANRDYLQDTRTARDMVAREDRNRSAASSTTRKGVRPPRLQQDMGPPPAKRGIMSMFGGRTLKASANNRTANNAIMPSPRPRNLSMRSPSFTASLNTPTIQSAQPLELEQKIENEDLPPPLLTMKLIKIIFPDFVADNYGFIIDEARVVDWLIDPASHGDLYTKKHRASSVASAKANSIMSVESGRSRGPGTDGDDDDEDPASPSYERPDQVESSSINWIDLLMLKGAGRTLLSRLPIQIQGPADSDLPSAHTEDLDSDRPKFEDLVDDPTAFVTYAEHLRDEISHEYEGLQRARNEAWARFLHRIETKQAASSTGNAFSRMLFSGSSTANGKRGRSASTALPTSTSVIGIANLANSPFENEFIHFVVDGIPMTLRAKIWLENAQAAIHYAPTDYNVYSQKQCTPARPQDLTDIELDAPRTLTNNIFFRSAAQAVAHQRELKKLLAAFTHRNPDIGYCQGFNIIAGYLLLALPRTEDAFWVFCFLVEHVMPKGYFSHANNWLGPRVDTIVLRTYIRALIPRLAVHLDALAVPDDQTVPINWLLTAFASTLSVEALFRVWDVVLALPAQSLFLLRVAIALLKANEDRLLACASASELYVVLDRGMLACGVSIDGLLHASYQLVRHISAKSVAPRREEARAGLEAR